MLAIHPTALPNAPTPKPEPSPIEKDRQSMPVLTHDQPPPSLFVPNIHPNVHAVSAEVEAYFLHRWPFRNDADRAKFRAAGFSRVTCLYFPEALQNRISFACRLLTLLFLVDGISLVQAVGYSLIDHG